MGKLKFIFTNILLWLGVLSSGLVMENVGFLTGDPKGPLTDTYFFMLVALALLCFVSLFILEHVVNKTTVDFFLLAILLIFLICGIVGIWLFEDMTFAPSSPGGQIRTLTFSEMSKVRFSISFALFIISMYSILFIFSKNSVTPRYYVWAFIIMILVALYCLVYSFIAESGCYQQLFTTGTMRVDPKSLFWNSNMFAGMLLMGICSAMILNTFRKTVFGYVSIIILYFGTLLVCSVLSMVIATFLLFGYFLFEIIIYWKKHPKLSYLLLGLYMAIIVAFVCLYAVGLDGKMGVFSTFVTHIHNEVVTLNFMTFSGRDSIWKGVFELLEKSPHNLAFGYGFGISSHVIRNWISAYGNTESGIVSTHNGVMQVLLNYGIVGLILYASFFLYFIYAVIRQMKKSPRFAIAYLFVGISLLLYSFGESVIFFNSNIQGILLGTLFYLPLIMQYKNLKHTESSESAKLTTYSLKSLDDFSVVRAVVMVIIGIFVIFVPMLMMRRVHIQTQVMGFAYAGLISLGILLITLPYLFYLWHNNTTLLHYRIRAIVNIVLMLLTFSAAMFFYYLFSRGSFKYNIYIIPSVAAAIMLVEIIFYSFVKKPSIKAYLTIYVAVFKTFIVGTILSFGICIFLCLFFQNQLDEGYLKYIIIGAFNAILYLVLTYIFMFKDGRTMVDYFNNIMMNELKRSILRTEVFSD